jgi:fatty-acyl-CoA synthase
MRGASLTMLHQPTPRTNLEHWAKDTANVIDMIEAKVVVISEPFLVAAPILAARGVKVLTVEELLATDPVDPLETGEDDVALMQLTSGSTGSPKAVVITHRNIHSNAEAMFVGAGLASADTAAGLFARHEPMSPAQPWGSADAVG